MVISIITILKVEPGNAISINYRNGRMIRQHQMGGGGVRADTKTQSRPGIPG